VSKLVPLNQCTRQGDNEPAMFASDHALDLSLKRHGSQLK
jgi:hypothetical protein